MVLPSLQHAAYSVKDIANYFGCNQWKRKYVLFQDAGHHDQRPISKYCHLPEPPAFSFVPIALKVLSSEKKGESKQAVINRTVSTLYLYTLADD
jgi:hypothetical protein